MTWWRSSRVTGRAGRALKRFDLGAERPLEFFFWFHGWSVPIVLVVVGQDPQGVLRVVNSAAEVVPTLAMAEPTA